METGLQGGYCTSFHKNHLLRLLKYIIRAVSAPKTEPTEAVATNIVEKGGDDDVEMGSGVGVAVGEGVAAGVGDGVGAGVDDEE